MNTLFISNKNLHILLKYSPLTSYSHKPSFFLHRSCNNIVLLIFYIQRRWTFQYVLIPALLNYRIFDRFYVLQWMLFLVNNIILFSVGTLLCRLLFKIKTCLLCLYFSPLFINSLPSRITLWVWYFPYFFLLIENDWFLLDRLKAIILIL